MYSWKYGLPKSILVDFLNILQKWFLIFSDIRILILIKSDYLGTTYETVTPQKKKIYIYPI